MPSSAEILVGLQRITDEWRGLAIAWHLALGVLLVLLFVGWRPARRLMGMLLAAPLASVSAMAWLGGNPFNGVVFAVVSVALVGVAASLSAGPVKLGAPWAVMMGGFLSAFAWLYPHFLGGSPWVAYSYASPLGLIPCPSLSAVIGVALVSGGLGSRSWSAMVAAAGAAYGIIGVVRLGVVIDVILLVGAVGLGLVVAQGTSRQRSRAFASGRTIG